MTTLMSFRGKISRAPYLLWSLAVFFSQYILAAFVVAILQHPLHQEEWSLWVPISLPSQRELPDAWLWAAPLQQVAHLSNVPDWVALIAFAGLLLASWALAALAFRRSTDAAVNSWIAAVAIIPLFQIPVIAVLGFLPSRDEDAARIETEDQIPNRAILAAMQGVLAGVALTLFGVAVSTLVFGVYGYGLFVATPLLAGALSGFFANRDGDIGSRHTNKVVFRSSALGGLTLIMVALEGVVCLVMAAPLGLAAAVIGGQIGRRIAGRGQRSMKHSLMSVALLPLLFAGEQAMPTLSALDTEQSVEVNASPLLVWQALLHMDNINSIPALPFRLGVAYPLSAEIIGTGIGATRRGVFSTGVATERITEWIPDRKLAFVVLSNPPAMHELSPYKTVHAPHVKGYFNTLSTSFELVALPGGRTRIIERTSHQLKLDPIFYWMPMARLVVGENNARVLAYLRDRAEGFKAGVPIPSQ